MKRRWLKRTLIALAVLLVLLLAAVFWLGGTGGGLRFLLGRTVIVLDDKFSYASAEGSLFGGMRLRDVRYYDPAVGDYRIALLEIAPRSRRLLSGELYLTGLTLRDVRVVLPPPAEEPPPPAEQPFALPVVIAPIGLQIERLRVDGVDIRRHDDVPVLALTSIDGAARWSGAQFAIERFDVAAPEGELRLSADVDTAADWDGAAGIDVRWQLPEQPQPLAGRIDLRGPQRQPSLRIDLTEPSAATIDLEWTRAADAAQWRLGARSEGFDLAALLAEPPVRTVAFDLSGTGTTDTAQLQGRVAVDDYAVLIETLAGSYRDQLLVVDALSLAEADGPGRLDGNARIDLSTETPTGSIDARWQGISPPLAAPFDRLAAQGRVQASGSVTQLTADIEAQATVDQKPLRLTAHAQGDPQGEIRFAPLTLATGNGRLDAEGHVRIEPALSWQADLRARDFDPGLLAPEWPGRVGLQARTTGSFADDTLAARIDIERLSGTLRQRPLGGSGHVAIAGEERIDADLDLRLGNNTLALAGRLGADYDARLRFRLDEPALLLAGAQGTANGDLRVRGQWPALTVAGTAEARGLQLGDIGAETLSLGVDGRTDFGADSRLTLEARALTIAGERFDSLVVNGEGDAANNRLALDAKGERGNVELALAGRYDRDARIWSGRLERLTLATPQLPALTLREASALTLSADRIELARACLAAENSALCLDGDWQAQAGGEFGFELTRLPLAWLTTLSGDELLQAEGELDGNGRFRLDAGNRLAGSADIRSASGRVRLREDERDLLAYTQLSVRAELDGERRRLDADLALNPAGSLRADIATEPRAGAAPALTGSIDLALPDLSFVELLTPDVVNPVGELRGRLTLSGTTDAPGVAGNVDLAGFRAELPALGLQLRDSTIALRGGSGNRIDIDGRIATAEDSTLQIGGWFGLPANGRVPMDVRISGERVLVADIPAARVFASPDLTVRAGEDRLIVRGEVAIPQARIAPEEIEGGTVAASPDVVIVDAQAQAEAAAREDAGLAVFADVTVRLGDRVNIEGYGLKGRLGGTLNVRERPRRGTTGRGEITVAGTYQAYGQDLDIERGRLLFTGSVLDNPTLDIRAVRKVENVTAGLAVTGTAQRPVLEVYSVPAMDQAEALSYLVLGRPLRQATSSADQDLLGTAATAVSTAGGDLLAKSLGARLGFDEVGVGTSRELGAGALTVGKYLSPKLYVGYGRSLFDGSQLVSMRYRLSDRFELEVQSGTRENKAGINYRLER